MIRSALDRWFDAPGAIGIKARETSSDRAVARRV
jgi:hypothetical protein